MKDKNDFNWRSAFMWGVGCGLWCYVQPNLLLRYAIIKPAMTAQIRTHILQYERNNIIHP